MSFYNPETPEQEAARIQKGLQADFDALPLSVRLRIGAAKVTRTESSTLHDGENPERSQRKMNIRIELPPEDSDLALINKRIKEHMAILATCAEGSPAATVHSQAIAQLYQSAEFQQQMNDIRQHQQDERDEEARAEDELAMQLHREKLRLDKYNRARKRAGLAPVDKLPDGFPFS